MQYSAITRISPQMENDAKEGHHYQELRIEENSYHNFTLRNWLVKGVRYSGRFNEILKRICVANDREKLLKLFNL